jgi:hypothetical protein
MTAKLTPEQKAAKKLAKRSKTLHKQIASKWAADIAEAEDTRCVETILAQHKSMFKKVPKAKLKELHEKLATPEVAKDIADAVAAVRERGVSVFSATKKQTPEEFAKAMHTPLGPVEGERVMTAEELRSALDKKCGPGTKAGHPWQGRLKNDKLHPAKAAKKTDHEQAKEYQGKPLREVFAEEDIKYAEKLAQHVKQEDDDFLITEVHVTKKGRVPAPVPGSYLEDFLLQAGLSMATLMEKSGFWQAELATKWLYGKVLPPSDIQTAMCKVLGLTSGQLVFEFNKRARIVGKK